MKITVIVPAYNEEKTIGRIVQDLDKILTDRYEEYKILVMNDCSTDRTLEIVNQFKKKLKHLKVYTNEKNRGKTMTVLKGISISDAEIVSFIDADYQYDPLDLPVVIDKVAKEGYDICTGIRQRRRDSIYRLFMSLCFNTFNRLMFGIRVKDVNCGMKAIRKSCFDKIKIEYTNAPWFIDTELLAKVYRKNFRVAQVPIRHHERKEGKSKVSGVKLAIETIVYGVKLKTGFILGKYK